MATVAFPSLDNAEVIDVEFVTLQGQSRLLKLLQNRAWVTCCIPQLDFQCTLIAIMTDVSSLLLPSGVQGMAGLSFLRQFARWGANRTANGWQFFLSDDNED